MTAQAIVRSMASLVVLKHHLWLNLTKMKDADQVPLLDSPVSPTGLIGPAVEGFAERFTAAQKLSQAIPAQALQLCNRFESPQNGADSAASKCPAASAKHQAEPHHPNSARHHPPKRQGPWLKIVQAFPGKHPEMEVDRMPEERMAVE